MTQLYDEHIIINTWSTWLHRACPAWFAHLAVAHQSLRTPATSRSIGRVTALRSGKTHRRAAVATRFRRRRRRQGWYVATTCPIPII